jgi:hypothetical protein
MRHLAGGCSCTTAKRSSSLAGVDWRREKRRRRRAGAGQGGAASAPNGQNYALPRYSLVISGHANPTVGRSHYALVCYSSLPLVFNEGGPTLAFNSLRNLQSGRPLGASQVTAVVARDAWHEPCGTEYPVVLRTVLAYPHFLRLREPMTVPTRTKY